MRMLGIVLAGLVVFGCASMQQSGGRADRSSTTTAQQLPAPAAHVSEFEYDRVHSAGGHFVTRDVFAANPDRSLVDVLRAHIVGFADERDARASAGGPVCALEVYLDGLRIIGNLDAIRPADLAGAEYYPTGTAPVKYRRAFSGCPVLLLWLNK